MFSESDGYERFMGRWSRRLAPLFVTFAGVTNGDRVLDVGSGTGALSAAAAAVESVRVTGIESSPAYVRYAQEHADGRFEVGDALALPFPDDAFDRTLSMLVLNFVPDAAAADSAPVPDPTSSTRSPLVTPANVTNSGASRRLQRPMNLS